MKLSSESVAWVLKLKKSNSLRIMKDPPKKEGVEKSPVFSPGEILGPQK